jgi:hypothetical protein
MTSTALIERRGDAYSDNLRLQQLWLAAQQRSWRSLAVVSACASVQSGEAANVLAQVAWRYRGEPTSVFDLRDVSLRLVEHQLREILAQVSEGNRVFIALRSVAENPATIPIARAADALVLCVALGKTQIKSAKKTLEAIGRERFLGSILVNSPPSAHRGGRSGP